MRLAERFGKVGANVWPDFGKLRGLSGVIDWGIGRLAVEAVSRQLCVHVGQVWLREVFGCAAMVQGGHKAP